MGIGNVRDYDLVDLTFLTATGSVKLPFTSVEISYQEDLFSSVVSGYILVAESQGYAEFLALTGNEFLHLQFNKSGDTTNQINRWFRVYKIDKRKLAENMYTESYCLHFCSEELMLSEQYKISKSYPNRLISDVIYDICTSGGTTGAGTGFKSLKIPSNKLNIQKTSGLYSFIIPNLKPFDAINWLSVYALPRPGIPGADMVFFENKNGFNFLSLQYMMSNAAGNTAGKYYYDPKNYYNTTNPDIVEEFTNVIAYEIIDTYDALNGVNNGMFANSLISVDILTRKTTTTNFDYLNYAGPTNSSGLNKYAITNNFVNRNGDQINETNQAVLKLVYSNFDEVNNSYVKAQQAKYPNTSPIAPNINAETYIPYRTAQLSLDNYTRIKLVVPGDPKLTVGAVIEFILPSNNPSEKAPNLFMSGNYLITATRHLISENEYRTIIEVAKESSATGYPSPPNDSSWQTAIS